MKMLGITLVLLAAVSSLALAADGPSLERGEELFTSIKLGTNGKSCDSCHSGGTRLLQTATYDEEQLEEIINKCIKESLNGKMLDPASTDMKSLVIYIKSLVNLSKELTE